MPLPGTVQFLVDGVAVGSAQTLDANNQATLIFPNFTVGLHTIEADYSGSDLIELNPSSAVLTETVSDCPVGLPDTYALTEDQTLAVDAVHGVLANDTAPNGDPLVAQLVQSPGQGTLTLNSDGSLIYKPKHGFFGTDTATYLAVDATTGMSCATTLVAFQVADDDEKLPTEAFKRITKVLDEQIEQVDAQLAEQKKELDLIKDITKQPGSQSLPQDVLSGLQKAIEANQNALMSEKKVLEDAKESNNEGKALAILGGGIRNTKMSISEKVNALDDELKFVGARLKVGDTNRSKMALERAFDRANEAQALRIIECQLSNTSTEAIRVSQGKEDEKPDQSAILKKVKESLQNRINQVNGQIDTLNRQIATLNDLAKLTDNQEMKGRILRLRENLQFDQESLVNAKSILQEALKVDSTKKISKLLTDEITKTEQNVKNLVRRKDEALKRVTDELKKGEKGEASAALVAALRRFEEIQAQRLAFCELQDAQAEIRLLNKGEED